MFIIKTINKNMKERNNYTLFGTKNLTCHRYHDGFGFLVEETYINHMLDQHAFIKDILSR